MTVTAAPESTSESTTAGQPEELADEWTLQLESPEGYSTIEEVADSAELPEAVAALVNAAAEDAPVPASTGILLVPRILAGGGGPEGAEKRSG